MIMASHSGNTARKCRITSLLAVVMAQMLSYRPCTSRILRGAGTDAGVPMVLADGSVVTVMGMACMGGMVGARLGTGAEQATTARREKRMEADRGGSTPVWMTNET